MYRRHRTKRQPLSMEKDLLSPIADIADRIVDTSGLSLHQLRDLIKNTVVPDNQQTNVYTVSKFWF